MTRRATTLTNAASVDITREIASKYDVVKSVSENLDDITLVANNLNVTTIEVIQTNHGFSTLNVVRINSLGVYVKAKSDAPDTLGTGLVTSVLDENTFTISQVGEHTFPSHGLTVGSTYFLSNTFDGGLTETLSTYSQQVLHVVSDDKVLVDIDGNTGSNFIARSETQTLTSGQVEVVFTNETTFGVFYVKGKNADRGRLINILDYTNDTQSKTITLTESYPSGTNIVMVYFEGSTPPVVVGNKAENKYLQTTHVASRDYENDDTFPIIAGVSDGFHYHGPKLCQGVGGRLHLIYRKALEHSIIGQWSIGYKYSDDGGRNWSTEVLLKNGTSTSGFGPGSIIMTPSGKLILAYYSLVTSGATVLGPTEYDTLESFDNGETWNQGAHIDTISFGYARLYGRMKLVPTQNSVGYRLAITAYQQVTATPTYEVAVYYSSDDGNTYTKGTSVMSETDGRNESEIVFINDKVGFCASRADGAYFSKTIDGGVTWTDIGRPIQFNNGTESAAPTLDKFRLNGEWYVLLGMFNRANDYTAWVIGTVEDLLSDEDAWTLAIRANTGFLNASGYQSTAPDVNGELDVSGGIGYVVVNEFLGETHSNLVYSYLDVLKQAQSKGRSYVISSGVVDIGTSTVNQAANIDTEASASTDDLITITGGRVGQVLVVRNNQDTNSRVVTLRSGQGNLNLNGDYILLTVDSSISIQYDGDEWVELSRKLDNAQPALALSSNTITVPPSNVPRGYYCTTGTLHTINGGIDGQMIMLGTTGSSSDVLYQDVVGNLHMAGDFTATRPDDMITFMKRGSSWYEISRSDNLA